MGTALERWREALESLAIPREILDRAPVSPYGFPPDLFRARAAASRRRPPGPTQQRAADALPAGGSILDVGAGAGAASLPLAGRAGSLVAVDPSERMLADLREGAVGENVPVSTIEGTWPDVRDRTPSADVAVCAHVLYNVADAGPFLQALTAHARNRVVTEHTGTHPLAWMADLWLRFHDHVMPPGPTIEDLLAVVRELGLEPQTERATGHPLAGLDSRDSAVALIRRRLCLTEDRDAEITEALGDRLTERDGGWSAGPGNQQLVTIWWDRDRQ